MTQFDQLVQQYNASACGQISHYSLDDDSIFLIDHLVSAYLLKNIRQWGSEQGHHAESYRLMRTAKLCKVLAEADGCSRADSKRVEKAVMLHRSWLGEANEAAGLPTLDIAQRLREEQEERWDGMGYHRGLAGEELGLATRIFHICDAYIKLISRKTGSCPNPTVNHASSLETLYEDAGKRYDPRLVRLLHSDILGEMIIHGKREEGSSRFLTNTNGDLR